MKIDLNSRRSRSLLLSSVATAILFVSPAYAFADTPTPDTSGAVAGGSTAQTTDQTTAGLGQSSTTTPTIDPNPPSTPPADPTSTSDATINNNVDGTSQSGNATVDQNQTGGNATTGGSDSSTTLINTIQSADNPNSGAVQSFYDTITGGQNGNVTIDPAMLQSIINANLGSNVPQNVFNNGTINNDVILSANSGNATVSNNGVGGNATTGNATTDANIINFINTSITDQQTFIGIINILGSLNGNIIIPQSLLDSLQFQNSQSQGNSLQVTNNYQINNDIALTAQSGQASVINNGVGGNATSGNASTSLQQYNLINSQIGGGNLLLVFVNVLGTWNGYLFNNPQGTTSAIIGSGIQNASINPTFAGTITNTDTINNNLSLTSVTGDALVANNGIGGNATSGNAYSEANIVNILGSQVNLSGWFGILFINVFGSWNGSVLAVAPPSNPVTVINQTDPITAAVVGTSSGSGGLHNSGAYHFHNYSSPDAPITVATTLNPHLLGDLLNLFKHTGNKPSSAHRNGSSNVNVIAIFLIVLAATLLVIDRVLSRRSA
ncbi:MAG: beta strand repeat-containing protein [Candidatus Saccharimonadales bacterium]